MPRESHEERVAQLVARLRARTDADGFVSLDKTAISHFVPNPHDPRHADRKLDVRSFVEILELDVEGRTCTAEPGVTFCELVRATLAHGLAPMLVPELETITLGGAVSGCAVESMAYKHGGFHDSCLEYEVVTANGEVIVCSRDHEPELFEMMHGSYGTLGIITRLKLKLIPAKRYVRMEYRKFDAFDAFHDAMTRSGVDPDVDFVDAIAHSATELVLCLGRFTDEAPHVSSYTGRHIYYRSTLALREDWLTTYDYFYRYDTDCHWATRTVPGMGNALGRVLFGGLFLGSTKLLGWSRRLRPLLKHQKHLPVVIDLFVPRRRVPEFYAWYQQEVGYYPLWLVPYRMPSPYPWIAEAQRARGADTCFVDFAVYGLANDVPGVDYSKMLEDKTAELGGIKTLISENHYDEATFWGIYDRARYQRVKRRTDPENRFRGLYEKFHFGRAAP